MQTAPRDGTPVLVRCGETDQNYRLAVPFQRLQRNMLLGLTDRKLARALCQGVQVFSQTIRSAPLGSK